MNVTEPVQTEASVATPAAEPAASLPKPAKAPKRAARKAAAPVADWAQPADAAAVPPKPSRARKTTKPVATSKVSGKAPAPATRKAVKAKPPAAEGKPAKTKLVRDSFTIPAPEYAVLGTLKQRALKLAHPAKKSELLRAGIQLLAGLSEQALLKALKAVPAIKTGRPKGKKAD